MLLTHHFNGSLCWIKIEFIILLSSLTCWLLVFLVVEFAVGLIVFGGGVEVFSAVLALRNGWSYGIFLIKWRQRKPILRRLIIHLTLRSKLPPCHILRIIYITNIILHQHQMCILIRSLLRLSLFNSVIQKLNSFFILFFEFGFDAFILDVLESVHLEIVLLLLDLSTVVGVVLADWWLLNALEVSGCVLNCLIFLGFLSHLSKFDVTFIENDFLNVVCWHLSHEKALSISVFVTLNNFIFKANKL